MVFIIQGSVKDTLFSKEIIKLLDKFLIGNKLITLSAHKTPEQLLIFLNKINSRREPVVIICVAGRSNALGGIVDANTHFPVINCPPYSEKFAGLDILSSLRMPGGVAASTVIEPGAAAVAAAKILSLSDNDLAGKIRKYQQNLKEEIIKSNKT